MKIDVYDFEDFKKVIINTSGSALVMDATKIQSWWNDSSAAGFWFNKLSQSHSLKPNY